MSFLSKAKFKFTPVLPANHNHTPGDNDEVENDANQGYINLEKIFRKFNTFTERYQIIYVID